VQIDPQCAMPIAGRQMIQLALAGLGELLALYPLEGSHDPIIQVEAALVSEKPAEADSCQVQYPDHRAKRAGHASACCGLVVRHPCLFRGQSNSEKKSKATSPAAAGSTAKIADGLPEDLTAKDGPLVATHLRAPRLRVGPDNVLRVDAERIDSYSTWSGN